MTEARGLRQERDDRWVVTAHRRDQLRDPRRARIGRKLAREDGSDAAALVCVRDLERDFGHSAVAHEASHPGRPRVAGEVADEDVVVAVDARQGGQLVIREPWLRAAESSLARAGAEAIEECCNRAGVAVSKRPDREPVDIARLHSITVAGAARPALRPCGPSS